MTSPLAVAVEGLGQGGWVGVDLFFTLSGFLITGILLDTRENAGYFKNFFVRRALRIFPLYYTVFVLLLLLTPVLHLQWRLGHLAYLFYVGNFAYCLNPELAIVRPDVLFLHLWSLAVEEQFYLIWPWVIYFFARKRRDLARLCFLLSAFAFVLRAIILGTVHGERAYEWAYAMLPTHIDGLLYGALAALWIRTRAIHLIQPAARRICIAAAAVVAVVYGTVGVDFYSRTMVLVGFPALAICFATVLLQALQPGSWACRLGNLRLLRFFGRYSYGLYVFHILFAPGLAPYQQVLQERLHSRLAGGLLYDLLVLGGTCVVAVLSYELYEKRWLRLKSRFEYRVAPSGVGVAS